MTCKFRFHRQFDKDVKRLKKAGWNMPQLQKFFQELQKGPPFPERYNIHPLKGDMQGTLDAHITHNWVVLFRQQEPGIVHLLRTGTHGYLNLS
ncbi:type II toxin-antitoxin system YafQ family toxin [Candidatus Peribacteria bacterium]|nr:type II toxin-antitoxin system YafQ family toxin [Candidatus Peribacteria bacterium]